MRFSGAIWVVSALAVMHMFSAIPQLAVAASVIVEDTFENIKNTPGDLLVVFYRASEPDHKRVLEIVKKVAKRVQKEFPEWKFRKCDGDLEVNKKQFTEAQFTTGTFVFTATPTEGIVKYGLAVEVETLSQHILHKKLEYEEGDIAQFTDELDFYDHLDAGGKPIFVKFYEKWCEHCKRLKQPFAIAASYFKNTVEFMEVECSSNEETTAFCVHNEVRSYPVLTLFNGEEKIQFKEEMRTISTFGHFFDQHTIKDDADEPSSSTTKAKKKDADKDDNDDAVTPTESEPEKETESPITQSAKDGEKEEKKKSKKKGKKGKSKDKKKKKKSAASDEEEDEAPSWKDDASQSKKQETPKEEKLVLSLEARVTVLEEEVKELRAALALLKHA